MTQEIIFIDETAFLALNDIQDEQHEKAVNYIKTLLNQTIKFATSFLVITQTVKELHKRKGIAAAKKFIEAVNQGGIEILPENAEIREMAKEYFLKKENKGEVEMQACCHAATMHYYNIHKIFTFHSHFDKLEVVRVPRT